MLLHRQTCARAFCFICRTVSERKCCECLYALRSASLLKRCGWWQLGAYFGSLVMALLRSDLSEAMTVCEKRTSVPL